MRAFPLWLGLLAACGSSNSGTPPDAAAPVDATPVVDGSTCGNQTGLPDCVTTCGNGKVEACARLEQGTNTCTRFVASSDYCDGNTGLSCSDVGYYGGQTSCVGACEIDTTQCTACAPGSSALSCGPSTLDNILTFAASGPSLGPPATLAIASGAATSPTVTLFQYGAQGLKETAHATFVDTVGAIAGAADGGWWIPEAHAGVVLVHASADLGQLPNMLISAAAQPSRAAVAVGPSGHAMVAWSQLNNPSNPHDRTSKIWAAIVDNAHILAGPLVVLDGSASDVVSLASDGTSFFLVSGTKLLRIAGDGGVASTTELPASAAWVGWGATHGWVAYATATASGLDAQQITAQGALLGNRFQALPGYFFAGTPTIVGDDIVSLVQSIQVLKEHVNGTQYVVHMNSTGKATTTTAVGAGLGIYGIAHVGDKLAAMWSGANHPQVAVLAQ